MSLSKLGFLSNTLNDMSASLLMEKCFESSLESCFQNSLYLLYGATMLLLCLLTLLNSMTHLKNDILLHKTSTMYLFFPVHINSVPSGLSISSSLVKDKLGKIKTTNIMGSILFILVKKNH